MKKLHIGLIALGMMAIGQLNAQEGRKEKPKQTPEQRFAQMDTNGDGFITPDETQKGKGEEAKEAGEHFKKMDANGDGKISKEEFLAKKEMREGRKEAAKQTMDERFEKKDANKDGGISREEMGKGKGDNEAKKDARFEKVDADKDGKMTKEEMVAAKEARKERPKPTVDERFAKMDKNADGEVTIDELKIGQEPDAAKKQEQRFKRMDLNADGKVTKEEFIELNKKYEEHRAKKTGK